MMRQKRHRCPSENCRVSRVIVLSLRRLAHSVPSFRVPAIGAIRQSTTSAPCKSTARRIAGRLPYAAIPCNPGALIASIAKIDSCPAIAKPLPQNVSGHRLRNYGDCDAFESHGETAGGYTGDEAVAIKNRLCRFSKWG